MKTELELQTEVSVYEMFLRLLSEAIDTDNQIISIIDSNCEDNETQTIIIETNKCEVTINFASKQFDFSS